MDKKYLDLIQHIAPSIASFLSTLLWVLLWGGCVFYFREQIKDILFVIKEKFSNAESVKILNFLEFQIAKEKKMDEKVEEFIKEEQLVEEQKHIKAQSGDKKEKYPSNHELQQEDRQATRLKYLESEKLAILALQNKYKVTINTGQRVNGFLFDGFFETDTAFHIVEIKYLRNFLRTKEWLIETISKIKSSIIYLDKDNVELIIVLIVDVIHSEAEKISNKNIIDNGKYENIENKKFSLKIECYSFSELKSLYS